MQIIVSYVTSRVHEPREKKTQWAKIGSHKGSLHFRRTQNRNMCVKDVTCISLKCIDLRMRPGDEREKERV